MKNSSFAPRNLLGNRHLQRYKTFNQGQQTFSSTPSCLLTKKELEFYDGYCQPHKKGHKVKDYSDYSDEEEKEYW